MLSNNQNIFHTVFEWVLVVKCDLALPVLIYANFLLLPWLPKWPKTANPCWKFGTVDSSVLYSGKKQQNTFNVGFEWPLVVKCDWALPVLIHANFLLLPWPKAANPCWKFDWRSLCPILCGKKQQNIFNVGFEWPSVVKSQIREQMCLETHFQYEFCILGHFGHSRKHFCFHGQKKILIFFWKYPIVRTKKVAIKNRLPVEFQNSMGNYIELLIKSVGSLSVGYYCA